MKDVVGVLRPLSLAFQKDDLLLCHVPSKVEETKSLINILIDVTGDSYNRLLNELADDVNEGHIFYNGTVLKRSTGRRAREIENTSQSFKEHFVDTFEKVISAVQDYLDTRFSDFDKTPLKEMVKIFNTQNWPSSFRGTPEKRTWGNEEVSSLANFYTSHSMRAEDEKCLAIKQRPLFREKEVKNPSKNDLETFTDTVSKPSDIEGMVILTKIMINFSTSTASCERGFSAINNEITSLRTRLKNETLDDIMRIKVNGHSFDNFRVQAHVNSWMESGKRHIKGHKRKNNESEVTQAKRLKKKFFFSFVDYFINIKFIKFRH